MLFSALPPASASAVDGGGSGPSVVFTGHGFGHGRGMSQWGAYGAADAGLTWQQILEFYYPGAARTTAPNSGIRVWVSRDDDGITQVPPQPGLRVVVGRTGRTLPVSTNHRAWRALASGTSVTLQYRDASGAWRRFPIPRGDAAVFVVPGRVGVTMPTGRTEQFTGSIIARNSGGTMKTIVSTTMETYLRGVVPNEMPASWHPNAVAAQAVAARTYAASYRARKRAAGSPWDICDSVTCQVYKPAAATSVWGTTTRYDDARADAAIAATAGTVLTTPSGGYVVAEFSASNGGHTVNGGAFSQVAKADPYDGRMKNPNHTWTRAVPAETVGRAFGVGAVRSIDVVARDGRGADGGRVTSVRVVGDRRVVEVSGAKVRQVLGLRSDWFTPRLQGGPSLP